MPDDQVTTLAAPGSGDPEYEKKITPKKVTDPKELYLWKCPLPCGNMHFRHAGYVEMMMPIQLGDKEKKVAKDSLAVHVCTKCRKAFVWYNSQMYDVTDQIDMEAWEKAEVALHAATGPGGQC